MSVLIKDMEMPKECGECDIYVCYRTWNGDPGDEFCGITKENVSYKTKPDWCPLSETSEPERGEWIDDGWHGDWAFETDGRGKCWHSYRCSLCNAEVTVMSRFCPHCGSPMVVK